MSQAEGTETMGEFSYLGAKNLYSLFLPLQISTAQLKYNVSHLCNLKFSNSYIKKLKSNMWNVITISFNPTYPNILFSNNSHLSELF